MHECFTKHLRMGTARMKYVKETDEDGKKRGVVWKVKRARKKEVDGLSLPNQNTIIIINIICWNFIRYGKRSMKFN